MTRIIISVETRDNLRWTGVLAELSGYLTVCVDTPLYSETDL